MNNLSSLQELRTRLREEMDRKARARVQSFDEEPIWDQDDYIDLLELKILEFERKEKERMAQP